MRPFSNGCQYLDWQARNCERCKKFDPENIDNSCIFDQALGDALFGDGEISDEVAEKIGTKRGEDRYTWDCPAKELTV